MDFKVSTDQVAGVMAQPTIIKQLARLRGLVARISRRNHLSSKAVE